MQDSNSRLYDSLYSGGIPRLLQAQTACLMSTEHDEINVHVVAVQSQVIANIKINSSLIKRLIQVKNIKFGIFFIIPVSSGIALPLCKLSSQHFTPNKPL